MEITPIAPAAGLAGRPVGSEALYYRAIGRQLKRYAGLLRPEGHRQDSRQQHRRKPYTAAPGHRRSKDVGLCLADRPNVRMRLKAQCLTDLHPLFHSWADPVTPRPPVQRDHGPRTHADRRSNQRDDGGDAVIVRVWRAEVAPARLEEYRRFERERCLPMFRKQPGFLGVLFLRRAEDQVASITVWEYGGAVEALESSPSYRLATRELAESGMLAGGQAVEIFEVTGALCVRNRSPWR
jgi:heme-degrading monooxygenase HmoA